MVFSDYIVKYFFKLIEFYVSSGESITEFMQIIDFHLDENLKRNFRILQKQPAKVTN